MPQTKPTKPVSPSSQHPNSRDAPSIWQRLLQRHNAWIERTATYLEGLWSEVELPRGVQPLFFEHCVRCRNTATTTARISSNGSSSINVLIRGMGIRGLLMRDRVTIDVPVCAPCQPKVQRQHRRRFLMLWLPIWLGMATYIYWRFSQQPNHMLPIYVGLALSLVGVGYDTFSPAPVTVLQFDDHIAVEFRRRDDAQAVAALNGTTVKGKPT